MPILFASCTAAPSATFECGIGSVKLSCTMPSPVVSPYGRIGWFLRRSLCDRLEGLLIGPPSSFAGRAKSRPCSLLLQDLAGRVVVALGLHGDPVETPALVG